MKALLFALLLLACIAPQASAVKPVSVFGRMFTEVRDSVGLHIKTEPLTPSRIYKAYRLSRRDYVLATDHRLDYVLMFYPRKDTNLPTIVVFNGAGFPRVAGQARYGQTKSQALFAVPLSSPTIGGGIGVMFLDFRGTAFGHIKSGADFESDHTMQAHVTGASETHLFRFTIKTRPGGRPLN